MGVIVLPSTIIGAVTPICDDCGIHLCWDISEQEYLEAKGFWDTWKCSGCNQDYQGALKRWKEKNQ